jgi:hypothetical protein
MNNEELQNLHSSSINIMTIKSGRMGKGDVEKA